MRFNRGSVLSVRDRLHRHRASPQGPGRVESRVMDPLNKTIAEIQKHLQDLARMFQERAARRRLGMSIPRVYSYRLDDTDADDAPDALVGARLRPRRPLRGSAIAVPEPDEDLLVGAAGRQNRP